MSQQNENNRLSLNPELNDGQPFVPITIRFKLVYTTAIRYYTVCPDWTIWQMMEFIKPYVLLDFGLDEFDIVLVGQPMAERGDALRISNNAKVCDISNNMDYLCLYVRGEQN